MTTGKSTKSRIVALIVVSFAIVQMAMAKTAYKAFVFSGNSSSAPTQGLLHVFAVEGTDLQHERIFLRSYGDGHVRVPVAATYANGVVYVADTASDATSARILVYSLAGEFQRVLCDDFHDGDHVSSVPLNLAASPNGSWLYVTTDPVYGAGRLYQVPLATGSAVCVVKTKLDLPRGLAVSSDSKTIYVSSRYNGDGGVYLYGAGTGKVTSQGKTYALPYAQCLALDEAAGQIYVGGYNKGYSVFDLSTKSVARTGGGSGNVIGIAKAGNVFLDTKLDGNLSYVSPTDSSEDQSLYVGWADIFYGTSSGYDNAFGLNTFAVEVGESPEEIGRWKLDESVGTTRFANTVASTMPLRVYGLQGGAAAVDGTGLWSPGSSYGVFEDSAAALGGSYGVFLWVGFPSTLAARQMAILSKRVQDSNQPGQWEISLDTSHHLRFVSKGFGDVDLTASSTNLGDGKWHHVGLVKDGRIYTLYLDGAAVATSASVKSFADDSVDLVLGGRAVMRELPVQGGTVFDDVRLYRGAPTAANVASLYASYGVTSQEIPAAGPTVPEQDKTVVTNYYGEIMQRRPAYSCRVGAPSVLVTDKGWYVSTAQQQPPFAIGTQSMVIKSENSGTTWGKEYGYPNMYDAVLYPVGDGAQLLGRPAATGNLSENALFLNPTEWSPLRSCYRTFDVLSKSTLSIYTNTVNTIGYRTAAIADTVSLQKILPGGAVVAGGRIYVPYAAAGKQGMLTAAIGSAGLEDWSPTVATALANAETLPVPLTVDAAANVVPVAVSSTALPGANHPFAVKYDPKKNLYWAVTTPDNTSIALYASEDRATWHLAQTILTVHDSTTARVSNPAFDFADRDLVLAFNLSCPDGLPQTPDVDNPNFAVCRIVSNFRRSNPFKKGLMVIFR